MSRSFLGIASALALVGAAACTHEHGCNLQVAPLELDFGGDAGPVTDASRPPARPAVDPAADSAVGCPTTTTPITAAGIEALLPWVPPAPIQSACTQENLDDLKAAIAAASGGGVTYAAVKTALGPTCSACAFSSASDPTWQVLVEGSKAGTIDNSEASCVAQVASADCGKKRFQRTQCLLAVCAFGPCNEASDVARCREEAARGACRDLDDAAVKACPDDATLAATCSGLLTGIAVSCAGGADAGIDASR